MPESYGLTEAVRTQMNAATDKAKRNPSAENLGRLGMVYHSSANYEQAAECYKLAISQEKSAWKWSYYLAYLNMEMGVSEGVIENFKRVVELNPEVHHAWFYLGEEHQNLRQNKDAEASFARITHLQSEPAGLKSLVRQDHFPLGTYASYQLARIYLESDRLELSETTLQQLIRTNRTFGPAYRLLSHVYNKKGEFSLSEQYVARANDLLVYSPPVDTLIDKLAELSRSELFLLKKIDEAKRGIYSDWALQLVDNALEHIPDNPYVLSKAIKTYMWTEQENKAAALSEEHISYYQEDFAELFNVGMLFFGRSIYKQSITYFNKALSLRPENIEVQKNLAICYWSEGEKQEARDLLSGLLASDKNNPEILADIANISFFNFGETEIAKAHLVKLKGMDPDHPKVHKLAAGIAEKEGRKAEAISLYESSFIGNPEDKTTIRYLGNLLSDSELWDKSIQHYRQALIHHPNDPYFLERLGTLLIGCPDTRLRNMNEGIVYSERAFLHMSSRPNTLVYSGRSLAFAYANLGYKQNALHTIRETMALARQANFSPTYLAELEDMLFSIQALDN
jgi:tetratricopeptide (TPR) repeat protein